MRESCSGDRNKVLLCNPSFPVLHEHLQCGLGILHLAEREFVNDRVVVRINKNAWRYPWLASAHSRSAPSRGRSEWGVRLPREQTSLRCQQKSQMTFKSVWPAWKQHVQVDTADGRASVGKWHKWRRRRSRGRRPADRCGGGGWTVRTLGSYRWHRGRSQDRGR